MFLSSSTLISGCLRLALFATLATSVVEAQDDATEPTTEDAEITTVTSTTVRPGNTTSAATVKSGNTTAKTTTVKTLTAAGPSVPSQLVNSSNDFAVSLYKAIGELSPGENLFMSPVVIGYGLGMLYAAAGGQTKAQLGTALRLAANADPKNLGRDFRQLLNGVNRNTTRYALQLASCLFANRNYKVKDTFMKTMNESFGMPVENLDFELDPDAARNRINAWVATQTNGKMADVFADDSITPETTLLMANTAYLKGLWLYAFDRNATKTNLFSVSSRKAVNVPMMKQKQTRDFNYYNSTELGCQVLELPYEGLYASMFIFLPYDVEGLASLETKLTPKVLGTVLGLLKPERVLVTMPKFYIDRGTSIVNALGKMGLLDLFDPDRADLSGLDGSKRRAMADIVHKAVVSVDEDGKVAAAMPAGGVIIIIDTIKFNANRPFCLFVRDTLTGSILFMGRVAKPMQERKQ